MACYTKISLALLPVGRLLALPSIFGRKRGRGSGFRGSGFRGSRVQGYKEYGARLTAHGIGPRMEAFSRLMKGSGFKGSGFSVQGYVTGIYSQIFYILLDVPLEQRNQGIKFDQILLTFELLNLGTLNLN